MASANKNKVKNTFKSLKIESVYELKAKTQTLKVCNIQNLAVSSINETKENNRIRIG